MSCVTSRIKEINQPRGGYINLSQFGSIIYNDNLILNASENIHASIVGSAVDYLTRFIVCGVSSKVFETPWHGVLNALKYTGIDYREIFAELTNQIEDNIGIDYDDDLLDSMADDIINGNIFILPGIEDTIKDIAIINACKLASFDVWARNVLNAIQAKTYEDINPDQDTIENVRILVKRCISFFRKYGPVIEEGFTFEPKSKNKKAIEKMKQTNKGSYGGYTAVVDSGDGDYLTKDTIWELKVSKNKPTKEHTLQLLMYWIMGKHSKQSIYDNITKLGIFNPRLNTVYLLDTNDIPLETIKTVEREVICYSRSAFTD